jgi:hypothetical protein
VLAQPEAEGRQEVTGRCPNCNGNGCGNCNDGWIWIR